jgi:transcriptional regulator with XRE-family HTH domain
MSAVAFTSEQLDRAYDVAADLGAAIRRAREARGMTQAELARAIGTSPAEVSNVELGKAPNVKLGNVVKYLDYLGLRLKVVRARGQEAPVASDATPNDLASATLNSMRESE